MCNPSYWIVDEPETISSDAVEDFELMLMQYIIDNPIDFLREVYIKLQVDA